MEKSHMHQEVELNYLVRGRMVYLAGGEMVTVRPGEITAFWAAAPHRVIQADRMARLYWFTVPFSWVSQWGLPDSFMRSLLSGNVIRDTTGSRLNEDDCKRWVADIQSGRAPASRATALEMEALFVRWADSKLRRPKTQIRIAGSDTPASAVQRMIAWISIHYSEDITVEDVAGCSGLHPSYAMTLFKKVSGMSILEHITQHRIFHAKRLLASGKKKILDVALESGFGSASRFYDIFQRVAGCTPSQFRKNKGYFGALDQG